MSLYNLWLSFQIIIAGKSNKHVKFSRLCKHHFTGSKVIPSTSKKDRLINGTYHLSCLPG
jgi:hypothetical protein